MVADAEGTKRPLTEIADATLSRSPAEINRVNRSAFHHGHGRSVDATMSPDSGTEVAEAN
jgi:hypothetical protein